VSTIIFFSLLKKTKMKKKFTVLAAAFLCVIVIAFAINSCKKSNIDSSPFSTPETSNISSPDARSLSMSKPNYNLDVILRGLNTRGDQEDDQGENRSDGREERHSLGHLKFRQDKDTPKIITLDVWVRGLEPNHSYQLQRAVDTNLDGNCTSTAWLTLGKGLTSQSILTDNKGMGQEDLWRDVSSAASGTTFDIHFQVIDEVTSAVVLTSDCYQFTVR
jgi:hypothetical protein